MPKLTIKSILNLTPEVISKLPVEQLRKVTSVLSSAANKRIKRLEQAGLESISPSYQNISQGGSIGKGRFGVRNKNVNQLRNEFKRAKLFLSAKTSTVSGTRQLQREVEKRLGVKLKREDTKRFWDIYNQVRAYNPAGVYRYGSNQIQQYIAEQVDTGNGFEDIIENAQNELERAYLEEMEEYNSIINELNESLWFS